MSASRVVDCRVGEGGRVLVLSPDVGWWSSHPHAGAWVGMKNVELAYVIDPDANVRDRARSVRIRSILSAKGRVGTHRAQEIYWITRLAVECAFGKRGFTLHPALSGIGRVQRGHQGTV